MQYMLAPYALLVDILNWEHTGSHFDRVVLLPVDYPDFSQLQLDNLSIM